jgi:hypothetical protein
MSQIKAHFPFAGLTSMLSLCILPLRWVIALSNIFLFQTRDQAGLVTNLTRPAWSLA